MAAVDDDDDDIAWYQKRQIEVRIYKFLTAALSQQEWVGQGWLKLEETPQEYILSSELQHKIYFLFSKRRDQQHTWVFFEREGMTDWLPTLTPAGQAESWRNTTNHQLLRSMQYQTFCTNMHTATDLLDLPHTTNIMIL